MPTTWDASMFGQAYRLKIGWADINDPANINGERIGETIGYGKDFARYIQRGTRPFEFYRRRSDFIISRLQSAGLDSTHRGLIIGSGFGYLIYALHQAGYPLWWGIDSSDYISTNFLAQSLESNTTIFDDILSIGKTPLKNKLINLTGDWQFHVIITENVVESYSVDENPALLQLATACEAALIGVDYRRIIHIVDDFQPVIYDGDGNPVNRYDPLVPLRRITLLEWHNLRPTHTFVSSITGEVILGDVI